MRVVSLLPAATEIVAALGRADVLVGVSHQCDLPRGSRRVPRVTWPAIDPDAPAETIDAEVRARAAAGAALFGIDAEAVAALRPDLILTQAVCDVCAVSEGDTRALAARLAPPPAVLVLGATSLDGVLADIGRVAAALGAAGAGERLTTALRDRMRRVHETLKAARAPRPRVAVLEWTDPLYAAGHWVPELVRRAGGIDVLAKPGTHSLATTVDAVRAADPEVIVIAPCGFDVERAAAEGASLLAGDAWSWARDRRVWAVDAGALTSRPGPGLVRGIEVLAAVLNPGVIGGAAPALARLVGRPRGGG